MIHLTLTPQQGIDLIAAVDHARMAAPADYERWDNLQRLLVEHIAIASYVEKHRHSDPDTILAQMIAERGSDETRVTGAASVS